jgi:hypothetical protein
MTVGEAGRVPELGAPPHVYFIVEWLMKLDSGGRLLANFRVHRLLPEEYPSIMDLLLVVRASSVPEWDMKGMVDEDELDNEIFAGGKKPSALHLVAKFTHSKDTSWIDMH